MKTLGLYIHIPFCVRKCLYCDFLSAPADETAREEYVRALLMEIRASGGSMLPADTVFIGGGTPSVLPSSAIREILDAVSDTFSVTDDAEITMEMNPGVPWTEEEIRSVARGSAECTRRSGQDRLYINRISLGLQSVHNKELRALGRIHTYEAFEKTFRLLRRCGIANLNTDLMFGIPGQTPESWRETLRTVTDLGPEHISAYSLILEEGTPFFAMAEQGKLDLPAEEEEREMAGDTVRILGEAGYRRYEISNYAKAGYESRHNIRYWRRRDYLGFGTGAASLLNNVRWSNGSDLSEYISCGETIRADEQTLSKEEQMEEYLFLGLRMCEGVSVSEFERQFGRTLQEEYGAVFEKYEPYGLFSEDGDRLFLTEKGLALSNTIFSDLIHDK